MLEKSRNVEKRQSLRNRRGPIAAASPKSNSPATPEEVKALIDARDWNWQQTLWLLLVHDKTSVMGRNVLSLVARHFLTADCYESLLGVGFGDIDPEGLLQGKESLKQAKKRLGKKSTNAVKQARHRVKVRQAKLRDMMPAVVTQAGAVIWVTRQP